MSKHKLYQILKNNRIECVKATGPKSPYQVNRSARKPSSASVTHMNCYYNEESRKQNAKNKCNRENRKQEAKKWHQLYFSGEVAAHVLLHHFKIWNKIVETNPQNLILNGFLWNMCESFFNLDNPCSKNWDTVLVYDGVDIGDCCLLPSGIVSNWSAKVTTIFMSNHTKVRAVKSLSSKGYCDEEKISGDALCCGLVTIWIMRWVLCQLEEECLHNG